MRWRKARESRSPRTRRAGMRFCSHHGIPQRYADEGDDYPQRCRDTTRELVSALGLPPESNDDARRALAVSRG